MPQELLAFLLPPLLAGIIHHFLIIRYNLLPHLAIPIDRDSKLNNKPIFGAHKTWRGMIAMTVLTAIFFPPVAMIFDISTRLHPLFPGALIGLFYSLGELPNSFLKRRLGIKPGDAKPGKIGLFFQILDHCDSVIAAALALFVVYKPTIILLTLTVLSGFLLHIFVDMLIRNVGYKRKRMEK